MRTSNVEPEKLVHHILNDLYTTKQKKKTQSLLRMLPVSGTCNANPEGLRKYAETFFQPWFKAPKQANFQIIYKARSSHSRNRTAVFDEVTACIILQASTNPSEEIADLILFRDNLVSADRPDEESKLYFTG
ncbi:THUMP domain-containing protein 1-like [Bufo gargarizans]|uniref:THUMP domain-containing protein 1-like n=1 Tax=Bufo gargarizans TaxID=30331 RepID=UPI001CF4D8F1|nr:THUMP domain-containing protein 1-like [Bufo gargarizans]